jgi:hypothetical protein
VRRWAALFAVVPALTVAGCGGENTAISVTLALDIDTCTTDAPDWIELTCPTAVGVALVGAESDEALETSCLDLPGTDRTLEALPPLLDQVDLTTAADQPVRLEIGLYAPRAASDGCPDVDDAATDMLLYGDSDPADLANTTARGLSVTLVCVDVDADSYETCATACDDAYNTCIAAGWCQQQHDICTAGCADGHDDCLAMCQAELDACTADECAALDQDCRAGCNGQDGCDTRCNDENTSCLQYGACDGRYDTCLLDCDTAPPAACASIY